MNLQELDARRRELYRLNTRAWSGEQVIKVSSKLDSSLKKNTAFVKKTRVSLNHDQYQNILKDIETISLERYLSEIIVSVSEGVTKVSKSEDVLAAMEVVSALHQRFLKQFSPFLMINMLMSLSTRPPQGEEDEFRPRYKNLLRLLTEFVIIGVFRGLDDYPEAIPPQLLKSVRTPQAPITWAILRDLLNFDFKLEKPLSIAQSFLRRFKHLYVDEPQNQEEEGEQNGVEYREEEGDELVLADERKLVRELLSKYTKHVFETTKELYVKVRKLEKRNQKAAIRIGKILEEHVAEFEDAKAYLAKLKEASEYLADKLSIELPDFAQQTEEELRSISIVELVKNKSLNEDETDGVWSDIRMKNFYTIIPKLNEILEGKDENRLSEEETATNNGSVVSEDVYHLMNKSDGEKTNHIIGKLEVVDEDTLKDITSDFHQMNINNKATRNRLLKFFTESTNTNNLRFYCKFLKINEEPLQELIAELVDQIEHAFGTLIYHNSISFKNIYFFVELIKFKLVPKHLVFHNIRNLTLRVGQPNILEVLSILYEQIGRFLLHDEDYGDLMREMLNLLRRKQKSSHTIDEKTTINNLFLLIDPPATRVSNKEKKAPLTPQQEFFQRLIRQDLNSRTVHIVIIIFQDLILDSEELRGLTLECFAKPELLNYDDLPQLAVLLEATRKYKYYKWLRISTIDTIFENVKRGLELNDYRSNRVRMAQVKYLAEMYNQGLLNLRHILDVLYKIVCSGHANNQPLPGNFVKNDPPDNYFRIQMCCCILNSLSGIGELSRIKLKSVKKNSDTEATIHKNKELLRVFLVFFQYYMFCKHLPIPIEVEFQLNDVFTLYGPLCEVERYDNLREAISELQSVIAKKGLLREVDPGEEEDDDEEHDEDVFPEDVEFDKDSDSNSSESEAEEEDSELDTEIESDQESEISDTFLQDILSQEDRVRDAEDRRFEEELEREFQQMVSNSYQANKSNAPPVRKLQVPSLSQVIKNESIPESSSDGTNISFNLLRKSGKKMDVKKVSIPTEDKFSASILKERAVERQHKEKIIDLVSNMHGSELTDNN